MNVELLARVNYQYLIQQSHVFVCEWNVGYTCLKCLFVSIPVLVSGQLNEQRKKGDCHGSTVLEEKKKCKE